MYKENATMTPTERAIRIQRDLRALTDLLKHAPNARDEEDASEMRRAAGRLADVRSRVYIMQDVIEQAAR